MGSWQYLIVGGFAAVGAAMVIGTIAAWIRFRRTGAWPGHDEAPAATLTSKQRGLLIARIVIGAVIAVAGLATIADAGGF